jgi:hypothetical protein
MPAKSKQQLSPQYIAGFIDGEGCFSISRAHQSFNPVLVINNVIPDVLDSLKTQYGGSIRYRRNGGFGNGFIFDWRLHARGLRKILPDILPHLILKKKQALIIEAFLEEQQPNGGKQISMAENAYRLQLIKELKEMNHASEK